MQPAHDEEAARLQAVARESERVRAVTAERVRFEEHRDLLALQVMARKVRKGFWVVLRLCGLVG